MKLKFILFLSLIFAQPAFSQSSEADTTNTLGDRIDTDAEANSFLGKLARGTSITFDELAALNGASGNIQGSLNGKAPLASPTFTGLVTIPANSIVSLAGEPSVTYVTFSNPMEVSVPSIFYSTLTLDGNLDLGLTGDTTLSRSAAGVLAVEGVDVALSSDLTSYAPLASPSFTGAVSTTGDISTNGGDISTVAGYGFHTDNGSAYLPFGANMNTQNVQNVNTIDAVSYYGPTGGVASFPAGITSAADITSSTAYADTGAFDIIYSKNGADAPSFPAGATYGANLDMGNSSIISVYDISGTNYITAPNGGFDNLTNANNNSPVTLIYGATYSPTSVSALVGEEGTVTYVNDATAPTVGAVVAGGGAAKCLVCYNGTNWIVINVL